MKLLRQISVAVLCASQVVTGVRQSMLREAVVRAGGKAEFESHATMESGSTKAMISRMLENGHPSIKNVMHAANAKMSMDEAVKHLENDLPPDVASLVRLTKTASTQKQGSSQSPFDEDSIQKARGILNGMIESAWLELDDVVFLSKEFEERNRGTYDQVVTDLARLSSQLSDMNAKRVGAIAGINHYDGERISLDGLHQTAISEFDTLRATNDMELTRRKNDLAVFDFILNLTACKPGQKFLLQMDSKNISHLQHKVEVCQTKDDQIELHLNNPRLQHQVEKMMTPAARMALRAVLGQVAKPLSLLELDTDRNLTSPAAPTEAVQEEPHAGGQWKKCVDGAENCGLLHDLMSLEWGKFRDEVDELTAEMNENQAAHDIQMSNFNQQFTMISDAKAQHDTDLAAAISAIDADQEESDEKEEQRRDLEAEYRKEMTTFRAQISEILHTKICAVRKVRNGILQFSTKSKPPAVDDCDVSDWVSKTGECFRNGNVITCDDSCPRPDPFRCGGTETMKRDVVVIPNKYGIKCPPLEKTKKCGQKKCEVDCQMSQWSGWSACSKDCGSGVRVQTRAIITMAKNGGASCDATQESESCNTGSCDRDCTLQDWTDWDFCSMACGGGRTTRRKHVLVPIRGQGRCPRENKDGVRLEDKECNMQNCVGDELCIARQDLIIALDASGSLKEPGFEILRTFAANLTKRYEAQYFNNPAVKIGVVVFGNGKLLTNPSDGTSYTQGAINLQPLTTDFAATKTAIEGVTWQRGYTNMAQAFATADVMLGQGGREDAQSAVAVITDGRYSMKFQTMEKARELKDKGVMVLMAAVTDWSGSDLDPLKELVTAPSRTNFMRIPGLAALKHNNELYVEKFITKFCPDAISPSTMQQQDTIENYMLVAEEHQPGPGCFSKLAGLIQERDRVTGADDCADRARGHGYNGFAIGVNKGMYGQTVGTCFCYSFKELDLDYWNAAKANREAAKCPGVTGDDSGWAPSYFYDTYVLDPRSLSV